MISCHRALTPLASSSISIACWVVVFSPQIIENFQRSSTEGLSLTFIIIWLLGDVFNILGAVFQGVIPTMTILAVYYTLADIVLLAQCFYYRGFVLSDVWPRKRVQPSLDEEATEESPLISALDRADVDSCRSSAEEGFPILRKTSFPLFESRPSSADGKHLDSATACSDSTLIPPKVKSTSTFRAVLFNVSALLLVCLAGIFGWWISTRSSIVWNRVPNLTLRTLYAPNSPGLQTLSQGTTISFNFWGQVFGYLCAAFYLGSRIPQLLLNYRRKSTDGVSILFFLFACVGNLMFVLSILAFEPECAKQPMSPLVGLRQMSGGAGVCGDGEWRREYVRYVLVNASWLVGSAGTLGLDLGIFAQFWKYRGREARLVC